MKIVCTGCNRCNECNQKKCCQSSGVGASRGRGLKPTGGPGNNGEAPGPAATWQEAAPPIELLKELWELIGDKLATVAAVSKAWREGVVKAATRRREAALARVTSPDHIPDSDLPTPQRVLRCMRRHLLGQGAFTGEPVRVPCADEYCMLPMRESDVHPQKLRESREQCDWHLDWVCGERGRSRASMCARWYWPESPQEPKGSTPTDMKLCYASLWLNPHSTEEREWMQGLLLALSEGSLGDACLSEEHGGAWLPHVRGLLGQCGDMHVTWVRAMRDSKDLLLLTMFHKVQWKRGFRGREVVAGVYWERGAGGKMSGYLPPT